MSWPEVYRVDVDLRKPDLRRSCSSRSRPPRLPLSPEGRTDWSSRIARHRRGDRPSDRERAVEGHAGVLVTRTLNLRRGVHLGGA